MIATPTSRTAVFLPLFLLLAYPLSAATIIQGGNVGNQVWTASESPYLAFGDAAVPVGQTLTVQAGVEVRCAAADATGAGRDPSRVELTIHGTLNVLGSASAPVKLQGQTAAPGSWYGIVVSSQSIQGNTLSHLVIQHAMNGVVCEGAVTASDLRMFANQTAIDVGGVGRISVLRGAIHGNVVQGFQLNPSATTGSSVGLVNCTVHGNGTYGVHIGSASATTVTIVNTIITGHGHGVYRAAPGNALAFVRYSDVWGNGTNLFNVVAGSGVISTDPLYIDADGADDTSGNVDDDLRLQPNSPCQFAGETGEDLGAYVIFYKLRMRPLRFVGDDARIPIMAVPDRLHQLQYTEDLTNWFALGDPVRAGSGSLEFTNSGVRTLPKRFYRIHLND